MKITREAFKNIVREVMTEESEYQAFFKKALEKTGKSIPDMSDEEKKTFFNKIDSAWQGKGEKRNEGNAFGAAVSDAKEKGEDEFEVGGEKFKVEEGWAPGPYVGLEMTPTGPKLVKTFSSGSQAYAWVMKSGGGHSIMTKKQWNLEEGKSDSVNEAANLKTISMLFQNKGIKDAVRKDHADKLRKIIEDAGISTKGVSDSELVKAVSKLTNESVNEKVITEQLVPVDKKAVDAFFNKKDFEGKNLNSDGKVLKTVGVGSQEMFTHTPKGVKMIGKVTGQYAQSLVQYVMKNHKTDLV